MRKLKGTQKQTDAVKSFCKSKFQRCEISAVTAAESNGTRTMRGASGSGCGCEWEIVVVVVVVAVVVVVVVGGDGGGSTEESSVVEVVVGSLVLSTDVSSVKGTAARSNA